MAAHPTKPLEGGFSAAAVGAARDALQDLVTSNAGITFAVLTSADGFEVAAYPREQPGLVQRVAAMSSSLQAVSDALAREVGIVRNRSLIIESEGGAVVLLGVATRIAPVCLAVVASERMNLGHMLWAARHCGASVERGMKL